MLILLSWSAGVCGQSMIPSGLELFPGVKCEIKENNVQKTMKLFLFLNIFLCIFKRHSRLIKEFQYYLLRFIIRNTKYQIASV